jgi:hypothetical protein
MSDHKVVAVGMALTRRHPSAQREGSRFAEVADVGWAVSATSANLAPLRSPLRFTVVPDGWCIVSEANEEDVPMTSHQVLQLMDLKPHHMMLLIYPRRWELI